VTADARHGWLGRHRWLAPLAVTIAAVLPYLPSAGNYFVADDFGVHQLLAAKPATYFPRWFYTSWMDTIWGMNPDEVRPFPALTYQVASWFGAGRPVADHVINLAFHAGNGLLVLALARRVAGLAPPAALFAAAAFVLLPVHAESVAWITGRVDTIPALFYLATYLAYVRWRREPDRPELYGWAVVWFFIALYSKQNTITMAGTLMLHDLMVERRAPRLTWAWVRPYVPFVVMTAAYLYLRYALFGEVAREGQLTAQNLVFFAEQVVRHLRRVVFGHAAAGSMAALGALAAGFVILRLLGRRAAGAPRRLGGLLFFFGPAWWAIGVAPVVVAGYESPRHVYLAAVAWAILLGITAQVVAQWPAGGARRDWQRAVMVACAGVLAAYAVGLDREVDRWNEKSVVSRRMVAALEVTAGAAPAGALILVGAPPGSWEWALPFAAQPPYTASDLTDRVRIISPQLLHCCRAQWSDYTRETIRAWMRDEPSLPVIAVRWDERTASVVEMSDADRPELGSVIRALPDTDSPHALDQAVRAVLSHFAQRVDR
jgi:hypothetical protein